MKKLSILFLSLTVIVAVFYACNKSNKDETILRGNATIYVDETLTPIVEDQVDVFESEYDAKINLVSKSESETLNSLFNKTSAIAILSRNLSPEEINIFKQRKINPKITPFATDAIAFVSNASNKDSLVALQDVLHFMQGKSDTKIKGLVFDNLNSSTVRYLSDLAGIKSIPENGVFSFKTNDEVIKHVASNDGLIGVVGVNWLTQPKPSMEQYIQKVRVLSVKGLKGNEYYYPSQNDIAEKKYPLARDLYIVNCQGFSGLGMGFASFVGGDIGQRIVLKSGLLPVRIPTRKFTITNSQKDEK
jgi:phosphate transport system substrate-binding protein